VSHEAMLALGVVLSAFSLLALGLYAWGLRSPAPH
jgi:DHA1 family bicyclomycin/chloramphenicol resistance-like MFS transporter